MATWLLLRAGIIPAQWHEAFLQSQARGLVLVAHRGAGKTTVLAVKALSNLLDGDGRLAITIAPTLRQSEQLVRIARRIAVCLNIPLGRNQAEDVLELGNGSALRALPARGENIRGFHGITQVLFDEAGYLADDIFPAAVPFLHPQLGQVILAGTPAGMAGVFAKLAREAPADWQNFWVYPEDSPHLSRADLDWQKAILGNAYEREFNNQFDLDNGPVLSTLDGVLSDFPTDWCWPETGGIDFGYTAPTCVLEACKKDGVLYVYREIYVQGENTIRLSERLSRRGHYYADPAGANEADILKLRGIAVRQAENNLALTIRKVRVAASNGTLKIHAKSCPNLVRQLYTVQVRPDHSLLGEHHAIDALRYLLSREPVSEPRLSTQQPGDPAVWALTQAQAQRERLEQTFRPLGPM
jgi:hypothetical protein